MLTATERADAPWPGGARPANWSGLGPGCTSTQRDGLRVTSRAQTVLDMAAHLPLERAVTAMDHALHLQHVFITSVGRFRTDFYWQEHSLVGEFDGAVKYGENLQFPNRQARQPGLTARDALILEKRREDAIRATGVGFTR